MPRIPEKPRAIAAATPPATGHAGFAGVHVAVCTRPNGTGRAVRAAPIAIRAVATTPVSRCPPAYVAWSGLLVAVTPLPGPDGTLAAKICSPVDPVSSNSGTGTERPTRTSTIGCAPMDVP